MMAFGSIRAGTGAVGAVRPFALWGALLDFLMHFS